MRRPDQLWRRENRLNPAETTSSHSAIGGAPAPAPVRRKVSIGITIALVIWVVAVGGGTIEMTRYANSPGASGQAPTAWPKESQIRFDSSRPTLVMFAHPRCPCTRASLGELAVLLAQCPGQIDAHVVFLKPADTSGNWEKTDLWRIASSIPGVTVCADDAGVEARRFHSETSGQTLLYDRSGALRFEGGITLSRGHAGDNPGRSAVQELLREGHSNLANTPVFGCSLFDNKCQQGDVICKP
jgi:hypothetical protein